MPKKSPEKPPSQKEEKIVSEEENPSSGQKKPCNEIDEIFAGKKRKKPDLKKAEEPNEYGDMRPKKTKRKKDKGSKNSTVPVGPPSRPRKKTEDGLSVYTEDELGINKADAGGTALCPFDCSCCF